MHNKNEQEIQEQSLEATGVSEVTPRESDEREAAISGEVERISATVEQSRRESELTERLAVVEHELAELKAASSTIANPLRRTIPASTSEMLAKHGIGDGPVDVRTLDAALAGLSLEQRIAVKTQLLRASAIG